MYGLTQSPNSVTGDNVISWNWLNNVREGGREGGREKRKGRGEEEGERRRGRGEEKRERERGRERDIKC